MDEYIYIGKIVNTHGLKGEIRILSDFDFKDRVFVPGIKFYLGRKKEYSQVVADMKQFLTNNKQTILEENNSLKYKIYYYAQPLLPIMKIAGIIRDYIKQIVKYIK